MIANVQLLRAIAALMVIAVHCKEILQPIGIGSYYLDAASVGVDLFFVISGFIMAHTTASRSQTPKSFLINRIVRLVPLYWILTAFVFGLSIIMPNLFQATRASAADFVRSLLFVPYERSDGTIRPMLFLGWSLNYEMFFYIIFAASLTIHHNIWRIMAASAAIIALVCYGAISDPQQTALKFFTRPIMLEFVLGMMIALVYNRLPSSHSAAGLKICVAAFGLFLLPLTYFVPFYDLPTTGIAAAIVVAAAVTMERSGLKLKMASLILLGNASYSLYLIHPFVAQSITKVVKTANLLTVQWVMTAMIMIYVVSCLAAVILFRLVEAPMTTLFRDLIGMPRRGSVITEI